MAMNFKKLEAKVLQTGEKFILFDGKNFQNFDRLHKLLGNDYDNVNDDLMDGITDWGGMEWTHTVYGLQDEKLTISFQFTPVITQELMNTISSYMNDEIREGLHSELAPCEPEVFLKRYVEIEPDFAEILETEFNIEL